MLDEQKRDLFPEPERPRTGPLRRTEPSVHWFTQITRPEAVEDRRTLNMRYQQFPDPGGTLATRLKSEDDAQHYAAIAEVTVHRLLRRRYGDVRYEEFHRATDFRVYEGAELVLSVEVMTLLLRDSWSAEELQHGLIIDALDERVKSSGYKLDIVELQVSSAPALGPLSRFVEDFISSLPPPTDVRAAYLAGTPVPTTTYQAEGILMRLKVLPFVRADETEDSDSERIVGISPVIGGMVNSDLRLKNALRNKRASRYDLGAAPYVVAVLNHDPFCSGDQWMNAFYGPGLLSLRPEDPIAASLPRESQGFYGRDPGSGRVRASRVSAALVLEQHGPLSAGGLHVYRLDNPNAQVPLAPEALPYSRRFGAIWAWTPPEDQDEFPVRLE